MNHAKVLERKRLEKSWDLSIQQKHQQRLHDAIHSKDTGLLLHEQCEEYKRYVTPDTLCQ